MSEKNYGPEDKCFGCEHHDQGCICDPDGKCPTNFTYKMTVKSEELLLCPFCGSKGIIKAGWVTVRCENPKCHLFIGKHFSIESWQTRHLQPEVEAVLKAARETAKMREAFYSNAPHHGHEMHMYEPLECLSEAIRAYDKSRRKKV